MSKKKSENPSLLKIYSGEPRYGIIGKDRYRAKGAHIIRILNINGIGYQEFITLKAFSLKRHHYLTDRYCFKIKLNADIKEIDKYFFIALDNLNEKLTLKINYKPSNDGEYYIYYNLNTEVDFNIWFDAYFHLHQMLLCWYFFLDPKIFDDELLERIEEFSVLSFI